MPELETRLHAAIDEKSRDGVLAIQLLDRLVSDYPGEVWPKIHLGIALRDAGDGARAVVHFDEALAIEPALLAGYLEAGFTLDKLGDVVRAEAIYREGLVHHPASCDLRAALASLLRRQGRLAEGLSVVSELHETKNAQLVLLEKIFIEWEIARNTSNRGEALTQLFSLPLTQVSTYWNESVFHRRISRSWLVKSSFAYLADHLEDDDRLLGTDDVGVQIMKAVTEERPFSLIRLADGEGAFVSYVEALIDPMAPPHVRAHGSVLGSEIWNTWLARDIRAENFSELRTLFGDVRSAVREANIVGVPKITDILPAITYIEYHGCAKAHAFARDLRSHALCVCQINVNLLQMDFYSKLLSRLRHVTIVTCHPALEQLLEARYASLDVRIVEIPLQASHSALFKYEHKRQHFPDAYRSIMESLTLRVPAEVFLVSAGVFGKAYSGQIKRLGGIAIDVGAVSDALAGFDTRPSIQEALNAVK